MFKPLVAKLMFTTSVLAVTLTLADSPQLQPAPAAAAPTSAASVLKTGENSNVAITSFLTEYCVECHGPQKQKGDRRFDQLALPIANADALIDVQDILDKLNLGEMPPKKAKQPPEGEMLRAIGVLTQTASAARARLTTASGQTVLRRLNRREYLNTIGDLFAMNMSMFDPTQKFPRDEMVEHMDTIGDTLRTSGYLLEQYLDAADQVVNKAFNAKSRPAEKTWTFNGNFHQQPELEKAHGEAFNYRYMNLYESRGTIGQEGAYGFVSDFAGGVPADGYYEIKVKAEALNRHNPYVLLRDLFGIDFSEPFRLGIVPGNEKFGPLYHSQPVEPELAPEVTVADNMPEWKTFRVWLDAGITPRFIFPNGLVEVRKAWVQIIAKHRQLLPENVRSVPAKIGPGRATVLEYGYMPQIRIHEIQIRGPLIDSWPPPSQKAVLGDKPFEPGNTRLLLEDFAGRCYRRPASKEEVDHLMSVVDQSRQSGKPALEALKDAAKASLCSPAFLYQVQPRTGARPEAADGKLSAYEMASRLSYFLWSSMPDAELNGLARSGQLLKADVLLAQTRRLLASRRSDAFVEGFLDSWLNLRSLGDMPPDRSDFQVYYAQDLQNAMRKETQVFTRNLITDNETIVRFLDSDYTFVNNSLARLYGLQKEISAADGGAFRKVKLNNPNRGGLLGQASVLTVSANGVETSPVTRGVWVLENILGTPTPPPPDNVPPIDPDVRGAKTMRDRLTKHRNNSTCFECHQKIDPLGFALESFDPIGTWRTKYESGAPIDTAGVLPGGESFDDIAGLKKILVARKDQFARVLTERLLTYACGRRFQPLDRPNVMQIIDKLKQTEDGFRSLIEQVVLSDAFRSN